MDRCMRCMHENKGWRFCLQCGYDRESSNPERALPVGTMLCGKYLVGAVIGEGGFGITYAAWDTLIGAPAAIKEYFPSEVVTRDTAMQDGDAAKNLTLIDSAGGGARYQEGLRRFIQEAENLAKFQRQPGVVSVKDFFYENNTAYMVMEYIRGTTLKAFLDSRGGSLGVEETLRMMEPVLKTLEEIHKAGAVHRDISPDNIMVTEAGEMKLIDFGAARFVGAEDEKSLTVILRHGYAPEEQYRSKGKQGPWTDVYALSAVIYRMLTGKEPEETLKRMAEKKDGIHAELGKVPGLSRARRSALEKGLAVRAEKRYAAEGELYEGLYHERAYAARRWAAGAGLAAAVVLCVAVVGSGKKEKSEETLAETEIDEVQEEAAEAAEAEPEVEEAEPETEPEKEEQEELEEPAYIRALREYYNVNYMEQVGNPLFVDITGDGQDEMLVMKKDMVEGVEDYRSTPMLSVTIFSWLNQSVNEIWREETYRTYWQTSGCDYYLYIGEDRTSIMKKIWNKELHEQSYEELVYDSFEGKIKSVVLAKEDFENRCKDSILLIVTSMNTDQSWTSDVYNTGLEDYESVLERKEALSKARKIAGDAEQSVLDYAAVYDGEDACIFAVTGEIQDDIANNSYAGICMDKLSVWSYYNNHTEKLEDVNLERNGVPLEWTTSEIRQFGKRQHYFVNTDGVAELGGSLLHKFCFEEGQAREVDHNIDFYPFEKEKTLIKTYGWVETIDGERTWIDVPYYIEVFYYDHRYVQYAAEMVDNDSLMQYDNFSEILQEIEQNFQSVTSIFSETEPMYYCVDNAELDHIRKSVNGVYYLNYKVYGEMENHYGNYMDGTLETREEECDIWAHAVLDVADDYLVFRELIFCKKEEYADVGLPVYYGSDREIWYPDVDGNE